MLHIHAVLLFLGHVVLHRVLSLLDKVLLPKLLLVLSVFQPILPNHELCIR